ncbi:MAG TPA: MauE/DoxX family redox-associated membrane protein [Gemmatimonadaceae bacterium]|nr:MauE/DoxX family redox-associated membrane protein [Gemmatimonadaceae bacterium]
MTAADWMTIGPRLVGATFIWAGAIKAIAPHTFNSHLGSLRWPDRFLSITVAGAAGLEAGWGVALLSGLAPRFFYPATIVLLAVLTSISLWGVRSGRASDCGCYGGFIQPSIWQSAGLNATFIALIVAAWVVRRPGADWDLWKVGVSLLVTLALGLLSWHAYHFEMKNGRLLFDTNPLKIGRRWKHSWAGGATAGIEGEMLVAFLGPNCPYCTQFVRFANAIVQSPELPRVVGVIAAPKDQVTSYIREQNIRFPVATVSSSLMGRLARAVPTAVIVNEGKIETMWIGNMPPQFVDRFRDAFFPDIAKKVAAVSS